MISVVICAAVITVLFMLMFDWFIDTRTEEERIEYDKNHFVPYIFALFWNRIFSTVNLSYNTNTVEKQAEKPKEKRRIRKVVCINTGEVFPNCTEADKKYSLPRGTVNKKLHGVRRSGIVAKFDNSDGGQDIMELTFNYV